MPIRGTNTELFRRIIISQYFRKVSPVVATDAPGAIATLASTITVTDDTGLDADDYIFVNGSPNGLELLELEYTPAGNVLDLKYPVKIAQEAGAEIYLASALNLGKLLQGTTALNVSRSLTAIYHEYGDLPIAQLEQPVDLGITFGLLAHCGISLQRALGYSDAETGAGTIADPHTSVIGLEGQELAGLASFRVTTIRGDDRIIWWDFLDVRFQVSGSVPFNRTQASSIPVEAKPTKIITREYLPS